MDEDSPVIYGLEFQARALCPQHGDADVVRFLAGTQSLRYDNQVHIVDFDDETKIINKHVLGHSVGEIWHINSSPADKNIISTCYNHIAENKAKLQAALWQIPPLDDTLPPTNEEDLRSDISCTGHHAPSLKKLCDLNHPTQNVKSVTWNPHGDGNRLIALAEQELNIWSLETGGKSAEMTGTLTLDGKSHPKFNAGVFSPHHGGSQVATAYDNSIKGWDLRTMRATYTIEHAHSQTVRDLDFNPNRQYYLVTCSDDCKVKFWDTRNVTSPLMIRGDHSHWIWSVRYNHFHDQLVLTSGSDSRVVLSSINSLSSEPFGHLDDDDDESDKEGKKREPEEDRVIARYDEHEDSVYAVEWSTTDPWIFASLSYDGRLVINRVPRAEKYKILL